MEIRCAGCGCVVDRGVRVVLCGDPKCCCKELPVSRSRTSGEPRIVNGYCVAMTFALERYRYGNGGGDYPDPRSKRVHAVKVTNGAPATSHYRDDAVRSAGGEQLLGSRLQVEVVQQDAWKDWLIRAGNWPELAKETCKKCLEATTGLVWQDVRESA